MTTFRVATHAKYCPHCDVETTDAYRNHKTGRIECPYCGGEVN
jgi:uncharacterized Zn finger protein (UPF0148 family)